MDFDDKRISSFLPLAGSNYHGFSFNNLYIINYNFHPKTGYEYNTVSKPNTMFNGYGNI
eukprot:Pgem_evm1s5323